MPSTLRAASNPTPIAAVIPDCCNIGVVFRTLVAVNVVCLVAILLQAGAWHAGLSAFVEASFSIELICLMSLVLMCVLRAPLAATPGWAQRVACALVPAVIAWSCLKLLAALAPFMAAANDARFLQAALAAALFGLTLQHYFELRTRAHSPALAEARLQALQARIRPHFLFNSLNAVLSLIRTEPKRAESTLEDLAELFRVFMRDTRDLTSLEKEIQLCRQYLAVEKLRLGERLQVQWHTAGIDDETLRRALVPSLLLQPLLENAVHYGVEPASAPALVRVDISRSLERIEIVIVNPHHPEAAASDGNHMALNNVRQRLALLYDVEGQLTTMAAAGVFEVRLRIPYRKSAEKSER